MSVDLETNLTIWNDQLVKAGEFIGNTREEFINQFGHSVTNFYQQVAGRDEPVILKLDAEWRQTGLAEALLKSHSDEVRRGMTLVGPHRDDLLILLNSLPSRSHASQGEQRSLALALRLATYLYIEEVSGDQPLVLLDDVFSELDETRARRLVECLPNSQIVLTSATGTVPEGVNPTQTLNISEGQIHAP